VRGATRPDGEGRGGRVKQSTPRVFHGEWWSLSGRGCSEHVAGKGKARQGRNANRPPLQSVSSRWLACACGVRWPPHTRAEAEEGNNGEKERIKLCKQRKAAYESKECKLTEYYEE
jgi:hypothetical protein